MKIKVAIGLLGIAAVLAWTSMNSGDTTLNSDGWRWPRERPRRGPFLRGSSRRAVPPPRRGLADQFVVRQANVLISELTEPGQKPLGTVAAMRHRALRYRKRARKAGGARLGSIASPELSNQQRVVIVCHTKGDDTSRIIGAREATPRERRTYESGE